MQRLFAMKAIVVETGCHGDKMLMTWGQSNAKAVCHEDNSCKNLLPWRLNIVAKGKEINLP